MQAVKGKYSVMRVAGYIFIHTYSCDPLYVVTGDLPFLLHISLEK